MKPCGSKHFLSVRDMGDRIGDFGAMNPVRFAGVFALLPDGRVRRDRKSPRTKDKIGYFIHFRSPSGAPERS
jgi:hypothetical protein